MHAPFIYTSSKLLTLHQIQYMNIHKCELISDLFKITHKYKVMLKSITHGFLFIFS